MKLRLTTTITVIILTLAVGLVGSGCAGNDQVCYESENVNNQGLPDRIARIVFLCWL